ncbi:MAG: methyltransferase domain-containing protein [Alphaproteobacteria bacterium]|nr:methyltransferase domain-containing protein [Alphaproteobacteria bacterium]
MLDQDLNYDDRHIAFLEALWGEGFLSPGGPEEVARILSGLDLAGKTIVDIGSGAGGVTIALARDYQAGQVIGLDVEEPVCAHARRRVTKAGVQDRVDIRQVTPGPFPLSDSTVDIVFSKDSIVHIPDKHALAQEAYRVLRPGGWFAASDWLISHDGDPSPEMAAYIAQEDLGFGMASPSRYQDALESAGFTDIRLTNRNPWYRHVAQGELARLIGPERPKFEATLGAEDLQGMINTWEAMLIVLESGEHCPHHFRARKP